MLVSALVWGEGGGGWVGGAVTNVVRTCSPTPLYLNAIKYV